MLRVGERGVGARVADGFHQLGAALIPFMLAEDQCRRT